MTRFALRLPAAVLSLAGFAALSACGGGSGPSDTDKQFVGDLCLASSDFAVRLDTAVSRESEEEKIMMGMVGPLRKFALDIGNAKAPHDLEEWQTYSIANLNGLAQQIENSRGNDVVNPLQDNPVEPLPEKALTRLQPLAKENRDCQDADFVFGTFVSPE